MTGHNKKLNLLFVFCLSALTVSSAYSAGADTFTAPDSTSARNKTEQVRRTQVNQPWGPLPGVLQFRGNPMRNFYGSGAPDSGSLPATKPHVLWAYPRTGALSSVSKLKASGTNTWTGTGWTGQPVVWQRPDTKVWEVIVGAFDKQVHFLDAETGLPTRKPFRAGDLVKGSVTLDPDGYPILYFGACGDGKEDGYYRALALDREPVQEIWKVHANDFKGYKYSRDWDGNASVINDHLIIGAEIGWLLGWKLNRDYDRNGKVTVAPVNFLQMNMDSAEYAAYTGSRSTGFEASCVHYETRMYCANGQGRIVGLDLADIQDLQAKVVFDFWVGDDVDATPVVDEYGMLYVAVEHERLNERTAYLGQLIKLNPYKVRIDPKTGRLDPLALDSVVWRLHRTGSMKTSVKENYGRQAEKGGFWATPALDAARNMLYVPSHRGELLAVDRNSGSVLWSDNSVGYHSWSSPNIIGDVLLVGRCTRGPGFAAYDISNPQKMNKLWEITTPDGGCVESSAAVVNGRFFVGTRAGHIYGFGW